MKIVILSDTHLTEQFDPQLYAALTKVIESAEQVIINGDFWDGYLTDFDSFVTSEWNQLFPLLKQKQTVYIYGNHDPKWLCDERVSLFSEVQTDHYDLSIGQNQYHIQHGHLVYCSWVTRHASLLPFALVKRINQWLIQQEKEHTWIGRISNYIEKRFDVQGDERLRSYFSQLQKSAHDFYITGHTHTLNFSPDGGYLNPGRFTATTPGYLQIDQTVTLEGREWGNWEFCQHHLNEWNRAGVQQISLSVIQPVYDRN